MEYALPLFGFVTISFTSISVPVAKQVGVPNRGGCFPSTARVKLDNGESVRMSELQVGDKVQTGTHTHLKY